MSERRNSHSSGKRDERSDLTDIKAMAAKARSETGRHVLPQNPAELSGVRPRRDSVVGMRLTPPPRTAASSELPNWFWGALGCLSVLLVGFAGLFLLGRSGKLEGVLGGGPASAAVAPAPAAPVAVEPIAPAVEPVAPAPAPEVVPARPSHPARREERAAEAATAPPSPEAPAPGATGAAADNTAPAPAADLPAPADEATKSKSAASEGTAPAGAPKTAKTGDPGDQDQGATDPDDKAATKAPTPAPSPRPTRAAAPAAAKAPAAPDDNTDDDQSAPGQDDVEGALDKLAPRVRGCFAKYGIKGTARVRLVAMPDGTADNVKVTGDFEDTPTGLCVESLLGDAKLPAFKGPPLKISQSYQFR